MESDIPTGREAVFIMRETTLCYIERHGQYLMLHRVRKRHDSNAGKWIGVGGGIEPGESVEQCLLREVSEETGLTLKTWQARGVIDFVNDLCDDERMYLFTANAFTGELHDCNEGVLAWVDVDKVMDLELWAGDRVFLSLLAKDAPFFRLRLEYHGDDLLRAVLDGEELAL